MREIVTNKNVIDQLIELGTRNLDIRPEALADPDEAWDIICEGNMAWDDIAQQLAEEQLRFLIKGLVHYSRAGGSLGLSVSPVIRLFAVYANRFPEDEPRLTRWVLANRVNYYEPFGRWTGNNATSVLEYQLQRFAHQVEARSNVEAEQARQVEASAARRQRDAANATLRLAAAVKRGDLGAVESLLAKGADPRMALPEGGSLVELALNNGRITVAELLKSRGIS